MLKLGAAPSREPFDVAIADGVIFKCRPLQISDLLLARRAFATAGPALGAGADDEERVAVANVAFSVALAKRVIVGWNGVADLKGKPLPVTPGNIETAMAQYPVYAAFERLYVIPAMGAVSEKNASSPLRRGTSRGATRGRTTASTASQNRRSRAAAKPAPT